MSSPNVFSKYIENVHKALSNHQLNNNETNSNKENIDCNSNNVLSILKRFEFSSQATFRITKPTTTTTKTPTAATFTTNP